MQSVKYDICLWINDGLMFKSFYNSQINSAGRILK